MTEFSVFNRYQPIINNWETFCDILSQPLPTCVWTNTLRVTPLQLADIFAEDGVAVEPLPWLDGGFKLQEGFRPGRHWAYLVGLYQIQEEVSMLPVLLLDPQPGDRILDMCAAPGNKTAQISVKMDNKGTVAANDLSYGRMRAARQTLERLGLVNVSTAICNGTNYPKAAGLFDKVLVDGPCSCEGTSRKEPSILKRIGPDVSKKKSGLQRALLRKAVQLCKPGGKIVYSTCTYAPEENEMVVDAILSEYGPDKLQLVPAHIPHFAASEGVTEWNGQTLHSSLRGAMRVWPHQNDTGGFFIAVLERVDQESTFDNDVDTQQTAQTLFADTPIPADILPIISERFGIAPDVFSKYVLFKPGTRGAYLVNRENCPPTMPEPDAVGMLFMKTRVRYPKLSTAASMLLGPNATRNLIELDLRQTHAYLNRQTIGVSAEQARHCTGKGYVLLKHRGFVLGVGVFWPDEDNQGGTVESMFPKGWSPNGG